MVSTGSERVDGRSLRAERTRRAVVDALHELLAEGNLKISARQIAERAGVSLRALWSNFGDMEGLYAASNARVWELQQAAYRPIAPDLPLCARVDAFCRQRARMLELIAPYARAAHRTQPYSPQLQRNRTVQIGKVRDEIGALFAAELTAAGDRRPALHNALLVATTYNAWQMAREELGLDPAEATAMMTETVAALLTAGR
jgi:AcrR family transcriptional regulator